MKRVNKSGLYAVNNELIVILGDTRYKINIKENFIFEEKDTKKLDEHDMLRPFGDATEKYLKSKKISKKEHAENRERILLENSLRAIVYMVELNNFFNFTKSIINDETIYSIELISDFADVKKNSVFYRSKLMEDMSYEFKDSPHIPKLYKLLEKKWAESLKSE